MEELHDAVKAGDAPRLRALLARGVELEARDEHGCTALMYAAKAGDVPLVSALLTAASDAIVARVLEITDADGRTALMHGARLVPHTYIS